MPTSLSILEIIYQGKVYVLLVLLTYVAWQQYVSYQKLAAFRGPFWAKFTNLWMAGAIATKKQHLELYSVSKKYGDLARVGPNTLLTADVNLIYRMSAARSTYTRSNFYKAHKVEPDNDNMFSVTDETLHMQRRAQMAIGYSGREIIGLEESIDSHISRFLSLIRCKYISTSADLKPMDLARKISFFTMDVITDIAFGETWGCIEKDEDVGQYFATNDLILPIVIMASAIPWVVRLLHLPLVGKWLMPQEKDEKGVGKLLGIAKEIVQKRFEVEQSKQKMDMMGSFIRHGITRKDAVSEATLQIIAGSDTTATTMRSAMLHILSNAQIQRSLLVEITNTLPSITTPIISETTAKSLPYLQSIIKESLRICPPATGLMSKLTPPAGDTVNGVFIPGKTEIGQCFWGIMRDPSVFGNDAEVFRPERWLEQAGEALEKMERTLQLVFGYGKYMCLGKNIAGLELGKALFELFRHFEFAIIDPERPWKSINCGLWLQSEMWVRVTERHVGN